MKTVEDVCIEVMGGLPSLTDARDKEHLVRFQIPPDQGPLYRLQKWKVSASWAPRTLVFAIMNYVYHDLLLQISPVSS
jgi:hypothetical protein